MIQYIIPLVAAYMPLWDFGLLHLMCLAFVATVPVIIRKVVYP